jgi:hypothetical protein
MDDVRILLHRHPVVLARVRDHDGIHDVSHGAESGWRCTCREPVCHHVSAVRQVTRPAARVVA